MNYLCFMSNLTSSEWAAWVQAVGSVAAIIAAACIAVWQSRKQHETSFALHKEEQRHTRLELAKTLAALSRNCAKAVAYSTAQIPDRESIFKIAEGETYFDFGQLETIRSAVAAIPLHNLPHTLVSHTMILGATVRQFTEKVETAIRIHRKMDGEEFADLFRVFREMNESLTQTCKEIEVEVQRVQSDA